MCLRSSSRRSWATGWRSSPTAVGADLLQSGDGRLGVLGERVLRVALEEVLEAGDGLVAVAERGVRDRGAEHRVSGKRAARILHEERVERLCRLGELAGIGESLRAFQ